MNSSSVEHWLVGIKRALKGWNPAKHPRGRDGKFLEVGDLVAVFSGPNSAQMDSGKIVGGHYSDDGRFFVAVKSATTGKTEWYRPKQVEQVHAKAEMAPAAPIPDIGKYGKGVEVPWNEDFAEAAQGMAKMSIADIDSAVGNQDGLTTAFWNMNSKSGASAGAKAAALVSVHQGKASVTAIPQTANPYNTPLPGDPGNHLKVPVKGIDGLQWFALYDLLADRGGPAEAGYSFDASGLDLAVHDVESTIGSLEGALQDADDFGDMSHPYVKAYQDLITQIKAQHALDNPVPPVPTVMAPVTPPAPPAAADPIKIPAGKTPASLLMAINTSAVNKGLSPGQQQEVADELYAAMTNPSMPQAQKHLAVAMTIAKLGGKQRARYKALLAMHHGQTPVMPQAPKAPPPVGHPSVPVDPMQMPMLHTKPPGKGILEPGAGNKWVNPSSLGPQSAKASIQAQIADRMADVPTERFAEVLSDSPGVTGMAYGYSSGVLVDKWRTGNTTGFIHQSGGTWSWSASAPSFGGSVPATMANLEMGIRQSAVSALVQTWASTSNDNNVRSLAMQDLAIDEFGLDQDWVYNWHSKPAEMDKHKALHSEVYRRFMREMYNNTQAKFKADGVKFVRLRRGQTSVPSLKGGGSIGYGAGATGGMVQRPMASYSSNLATAKSFGSYRHEAYVPVERIIGTALTGFGCQHEYEFVVLGGPNEVAVVS